MWWWRLTVAWVKLHGRECFRWKLLASWGARQSRQPSWKTWQGEYDQFNWPQDKSALRAPNQKTRWQPSLTENYSWKELASPNWGIPACQKYSEKGSLLNVASSRCRRYFLEVNDYGWKNLGCSIRWNLQKALYLRHWVRCCPPAKINHLSEGQAGWLNWDLHQESHGLRGVTKYRRAGKAEEFRLLNSQTEYYKRCKFAICFLIIWALRSDWNRSADCSACSSAKTRHRQSIHGSTGANGYGYASESRHDANGGASNANDALAIDANGT